MEGKTQDIEKIQIQVEKLHPLSQSSSLQVLSIRFVNSLKKKELAITIVTNHRLSSVFFVSPYQYPYIHMAYYLLPLILLHVRVLTIAKTTTTTAATTAAVAFLLGASSLPSAATAFNNNNNNNNNNQQQQQPIMRAWTCHGKNQRELVDRLKQANIVKSPYVQKVMEEVDRINYVPNDPYMDSPQTIGLGQTISAPHMHAYVLEEMYPYILKSSSSKTTATTTKQELSSPVRILDVGCGSGYLTAALGRWLQSKPTTTTTDSSETTSTNNDQDASGSSSSSRSSILFPNGTPLNSKVFGIDVHAPLIGMTTTNIQKSDGDLFDTGMITLSLRDGWKGWPEYAPFDAIHVGAAAEKLPEDLASQLKVGGVLIIPIGPNGGEQKLYKIERIHDTSSSSAAAAADTRTTTTTTNNKKYVPEDYRISVLLGVRYVPLVQHPELRN